MTKPITWAQEQRLNWIAEMCEIYGFINREHLVKKFRISTPQAALDFGLFARTRPEFLVYDPHKKHYRIAPGRD